VKKRWLIRSIFIGLLTLCVGTWVGSYWQGIGIDYGGTERNLGLTGADGEAVLAAEDNDPFGSVLGWHFYRFNRAARSGTGYEYAQYRLLGFGFEKVVRPTCWFVWVPLWFPILLFALLLWFVWRKTKAKPVGRAFPVEPVGKLGVKQA
jgi:hypothetical protein